MKLNIPVYLQDDSQLEESWSEICGSQKASAVIALLFSQSPAHWSLAFTRRSTKVGSHKGQISFAGGRRDQKDHTPVDTALRELEEELGIKSQDVTILKKLPTLKSLDGHPLVPLLGVTNIRPENWRPSPEEVAYVFSVPTIALTKSQRKEFAFNIFGQWRQSSLYEWNEERIWGLTAHIIDQLNFHS